MKRLSVLILAIALGGSQFWSSSPALAQVLSPDLDVSPSPVLAGGAVTVTGNSWTPFSAVRVSIQLPGQNLSQLVAASGWGTFATTFTIPASTSPGLYHAVAQVSTFTPVPAAFTVIRGVQDPQLYTFPHTVSPGGILTVEGSNFRPFAAVNVGIIIPGPDQFQTVAANGQGSFSARFAVPSSIPTGIYRATAQVATFTPVSVDFTVQVGASVYVAPNPVRRGLPMTVVGTNWPANTLVRVVLLFPQAQTVTPITNSQGTFTFRVTAPTSTPPGRYDLSAQVGTNTPFDTDFWLQ